MFRKVTILKDAIDPFFNVIFTKQLKYLDDVEKKVIEIDEETESWIRRVITETDKLQDWLQKEFEEKAMAKGE